MHIVYTLVNFRVVDGDAYAHYGFGPTTTWRSACICVYVIDMLVFAALQLGCRLHIARTGKINHRRLTKRTAKPILLRL